MVAKKSLNSEDSYHSTSVKAVKKSKLKHTSTKPLVPLHASKDPKRFRKPTPAISFSSSKSSAAAYCQQNEAVSRPVTPDVQDSAVPPKPTIGLETTKAIKSALLVFSKNLTKLNPNVLVTENMRSAGLCLLEEAVSIDAELAAWLLTSSRGLLAASAASLWIAIKFCGIRVMTPNGELMAQASHVKLADLAYLERQLLKSLQWGISAVLRSNDIAMAC